MNDDPRPVPRAAGGSEPDSALPAIAPSAETFPADSDVEEVDQGRGPSPLPVLGVIAVGGVVGALGRYQIGESWPTAATAFPWPTLTVNVVGCFLIGVLIVLVTERFQAHPLVRPLLGTGVLGGFTTFSTYTIDLHRLLTNGHPLTALAYLAATAVAAVAAAAAGMLGTRRFSGVR